MIKIPATPEGLPAITRTLAEGISVNVTLIFSVARYREVMDAFLAGMEQAKASGRDLSAMASVASFFVSRVDSEVDKRLEKIGTDAALGLRGTAAIANARLAYAAYLDVFSTERWAALKGSGASSQRPLWASTGVKNKAYPDTYYVTELVAPDTVNTMPAATLTPSRTTASCTATPSAAPMTPRARSSPRWPRSGSTSTTSTRCSRMTGCRSSPTRGSS